MIHRKALLKITLKFRLCYNTTVGIFLDIARQKKKGNNVEHNGGKAKWVVCVRAVAGPLEVSFRTVRLFTREARCKCSDFLAVRKRSHTGSNLMVTSRVRFVARPQPIMGRTTHATLYVRNENVLHVAALTSPRLFSSKPRR